MRKLAAYTTAGGNGSIIRWEIVDETATVTDPQLAALVDIATVPSGFETNWMDYEVLSGNLHVVSSPQGETELMSSVNSDYPRSLTRMNDMSIFNTL